MIKTLLHALTRRMSEQYDYDNTYLHEIIDVSAIAGMRFMGLPMLSQMQGPNVEVWAGAALGSVLDGDCGPCAQLILDQAVASGVPAEKLKALLEGDIKGALGLGYRFAEAAIADKPELSALRQTIQEHYGDLAVIAAAYAAASARAYPVLKRGLGHGDMCQRLKLAGESLVVRGGLSQTVAQI